LNFCTINAARKTSAALQLTPDQDKLGPPIEDAIRARGKDRQARLEAIQKEVGELRGKSPPEVLCDRNPVDFLSQRKYPCFDCFGHAPMKYCDACRQEYGAAAG
jgi:hypothetical protein